MPSLQSAMDLVKAIAGIAQGVQDWLVAKGLIETTQQTPAIAQLPSVRAALLEAEKEAAAKKQAAIDMAATEAEFGGAAAIDIQGQIYDAAIGGGPTGSGFSNVISEGVARAGVDTTGGVTLKNIAAGIQAGAALLNSRGGFPVCAACNPISIIAGLVSKAGNFSIRDIPNFKGVTVPTYDLDGVQNGTEVVTVLLGNASTLPVKPEQIELPPSPNVPVQPKPTIVMPLGLAAKINQNAFPSLGNGLFGAIMENSIPAPDATADQALAEAAAERGQVG